MNPILERSKDAAGQAFDKVRKIVGIPTDPSIRMYMQMTPTRLEELERRVGTERTMAYIYHMERKLRRSKHASS